MSVDFYTRHAERFYAKRWWFLAASIGIFCILFLTLSFSSSKVNMLMVALLAPLIFASWGLLCMCVWFHPVKGNMQPNSKIFGRFPLKLQIFFRWYAAFFLTLFMFFGVIIFPIFAFFSALDG
jgi:hypothetical protein